MWQQRGHQDIAHATAAGQGTQFKNIPLTAIGGVGAGSSECRQLAVIPIFFNDGIAGTFSSNVVSDSELPALLGLQTLEKFGCIIDIRHRKLILTGPGGIEYKLSPGSRVFDMIKCPTGHLLLPCTEWTKFKQHGTAEANANAGTAVADSIETQE